MNQSQRILGISAFYHDSAAALIEGETIRAAAQEERFTRIKHDPQFPLQSLLYCLNEGKIQLEDLDALVYYEKPFWAFERLLENYYHFAPRGFSSFITGMPDFLHRKLFVRTTIRKALKKHFGKKVQIPQILFSEHHLSHAASAFYPSPFDEAAVLCCDGVGEWATVSAWQAAGRKLVPLWEIEYPHSLGLLYSAFTTYLGFKVNSAEYKVMGLAPYGRPIYVDLIKEHLIDIKEDGSFHLNMDYFNYCTGLRMTSSRFHNLFGGPPRAQESKLGQREMDLARSVQEVTEEVMLRLARTLHQQTGQKNLCLAGGVALNCVANGRILREGPFEQVWIQPASGDAGGALGSALAALHDYFGVERLARNRETMRGAYLGPVYQESQIQDELRDKGIRFQSFSETDFVAQVAQVLASGKVVGWFQGAMEYGPRALGARSILADPRGSDMQSRLNLKIKFRESFRPFAPAVLEEDLGEYFEMKGVSPYMLLTAPVRQERRRKPRPNEEALEGIDLLKVPRSDIPAVTHVDYSARVQTVNPNQNPKFYSLLKKFKELTGTSVLVNTSMNVRGEPIVCTPWEAV